MNNLIYIEYIFFIIDKEWLCCDQFTLADVNFAVLLHRFSLLGLDDFFWNADKPKIKYYYSKLLKRETFLKSLPTKLEIWKSVWSNTPSNYKIVAGIVGISTLGIIGSLILSKKEITPV